MYVPPYQSLMRNFGVNKINGQSADTVTISVDLLKMLLQIAVAHAPFYEEVYFRENPDVKEAVDRDDIESGHMHFIGFGYFEGRRGGTAIDENWYLRKYPDVAAGVRGGQVQSAGHHFHMVGGGEGRSPSAELEVDAERWKRALGLK